MNQSSPQNSPHPAVAIVGGGLAGLAAAVKLCESGFHVELFEARRKLGGRAGSFVDPATGETVDHCQHVAMGCCTSFLEFCRRTGVADLLRWHDTLHFFGPDGRRYDLRGAKWLPAPLHLAPSLLKLGYLSWRERLRVGVALLRLAREKPPTSRTRLTSDRDEPTIGDWLRRHGQSQRAIDRFWSFVLVSALGETVDRASLWAARKVFVDGFMSSRTAYHIAVPTVPLSELYARIADWLRRHGVILHLESPIARVTGTAVKATGVELADGSLRPFDSVIVAVPWRRVRSLFPDDLAAAIPELQTVSQIESSPISSLHLWFDRPITDLPHAVLVDRLSQWLFNRGSSPSPDSQETWHAYQVVISASRDLTALSREAVRDTIVEELGAIWPAARSAHIQHWRLVTEPDAVFSYRPGFDRLRPAPQTPIENILLAGDWTATDWPATMESAVRSGYAAAANCTSAFPG